MGRREEHALKQLLRITILLIGLIWILAWAAAGRFDDTPNTQDGSESPLPSGEIAAPGERDSAKTLRVQIQGEVQEMDMGTYLLGVLRAEMPASFEEEALKAQAIAARTYTLYRIRGGGSANHPDADACDDHTCCKAYINAEQAAANWGSMAVYYEEKLARAVSETDGEVILYDGAPILAVFFSSADGSTQGAGDVWMNDLPYLQKVDSPETEELVPNYYSVATFTAAEFKSSPPSRTPTSPAAPRDGSAISCETTRTMSPPSRSAASSCAAMTCARFSRCARRRSPWNTRTMPLPSTSQATATVSA